MKSPETLVRMRYGHGAGRAGTLPASITRAIVDVMPSLREATEQMLGAHEPEPRNEK